MLRKIQLQNVFIVVVYVKIQNFSIFNPQPFKASLCLMQSDSKKRAQWVSNEVLLGARFFVTLYERWKVTWL